MVKVRPDEVLVSSLRKKEEQSLRKVLFESNKDALRMHSREVAESILFRGHNAPE